MALVGNDPRVVTAFTKSGRAETIFTTIYIDLTTVIAQADMNSA
jgi:hypothetical protein